MPQTCLLEQCQRLHIRDVQAAIPQSSLSAVLQIESGFGVEDVQVVGKLTNLHNGYRYYFVCPRCAAHYMSLYRKDFGQLACRECLGLLYSSSLRIEL